MFLIQDYIFTKNKKQYIVTYIFSKYIGIVFFCVLNDGNEIKNIYQILKHITPDKYCSLHDFGGG
jgi:hypothetical protein